MNNNSALNEFLENLKRQATENPIVALGVGIGVVGAITMHMEVNTHAKNAKTDLKNAQAWEREVNRRAAKDAKS